IALLIVAGLIMVSASLAKERGSRRAAETASVKSRQGTRVLEEMVRGGGPAAVGQDTRMLRGMVDRTAERIGKEMTNQPAIEAELRSLIGRLYFEIGNYEGAGKMHRTALAFYRKQFGPRSQETATGLNDLGVVLSKQGNLTE